MKKQETLKESDLYPPVKGYLEKNGYKVNAEVQGCDVTATKNKELVIIELKTSFNLTLVYQAVERQKVSDSVYVAIPVTQARSTPPNLKKMCMLLKRLELGLILVHFLKTKSRVEIMFHPQKFERYKNRKRERAIIRETSERVSDTNLGGATSREKKVTLYKQQAVHIAVFLQLGGESSPKMLVLQGCSKNTGNILRDNHYGWFDKVERGVYTLNKHGKSELKNFSELYSFFSEEYKNLVKKKDKNK